MIDWLLESFFFVSVANLEWFIPFRIRLLYSVQPLRVQDPPPSGTGIILKAYLEILKITVH